MLTFLLSKKKKKKQGKERKFVGQEEAVGIGLHGWLQGVKDQR